VRGGERHDVFWWCAGWRLSDSLRGRFRGVASAFVADQCCVGTRRFASLFNLTMCSVQDHRRDVEVVPSSVPDHPAGAMWRRVHAQAPVSGGVLVPNALMRLRVSAPRDTVTTRSSSVSQVRPQGRGRHVPPASWHPAVRVPSHLRVQGRRHAPVRHDGRCGCGGAGKRKSRLQTDIAIFSLPAGSHTEALKEFRRCKQAFSLVHHQSELGSGGGPTVTSSKVCVGWYRVEGNMVSPVCVRLSFGNADRPHCTVQVRVEVLGAYGILTRWHLTIASENGGCNNRLRVDALVRAAQSCRALPLPPHHHSLLCADAVRLRR